MARLTADQKIDLLVEALQAYRSSMAALLDEIGALPICTDVSTCEKLAHRALVGVENL